MEKIVCIYIFYHNQQNVKVLFLYNSTSIVCYLWKVLREQENIGGKGKMGRGMYGTERGQKQGLVLISAYVAIRSQQSFLAESGSGFSIY